MPEYFDKDGTRSARIQEIQERVYQIRGYVKGTKPDTSPAAQDELARLNQEWEHLADLNLAEARENMPTHAAICASCGHRRDMHAGSGARCNVVANPEEFCNCTGFEYSRRSA